MEGHVQSEQSSESDKCAWLSVISFSSIQAIPSIQHEKSRSTTHLIVVFFSFDHPTRWPVVPFIKPAPMTTTKQRHGPCLIWTLELHWSRELLFISVILVRFQLIMNGYRKRWLWRGTWRKNLPCCLTHSIEINYTHILYLLT